MAVKKLSRLESNKEARRVLNRHGVDLGYCQYSCSGKEVRLTGTLVRFDGTQFRAQQIEGMIYDFQRLLPGYVIVGELDNWSFSSEHISFHGSHESEDEELEEEEDFGEIT
ncbi:MAG TPA: hypothetical protein VKZ84_06805 [Bacteriovoracaceae bacterium]|nr:hypothetical protein [Bacteriovoracaceae bacterium]